MLRAIGTRLHADASFHAAIHGIKLPKQNKTEPDEPLSLQEKDIKAMDDALMRAKLKKQEEFAKRYGK